MFQIYSSGHLCIRAYLCITIHFQTPTPGVAFGFGWVSCQPCRVPSGPTDEEWSPAPRSAIATVQTLGMQVADWDSAGVAGARW